MAAVAQAQGPRGPPRLSLSRSRDLLKKALTHASVRQASGKRRDNERLEFLGDRVLGLAIAELLSEAYPGAERGRAGAPLQSPGARGTCAAGGARARSRAVPGAERAEAESGGRDKETILADACEALLGAIFLEAGYDQAREVVRAHWGARLEARAGRGGRCQVRPAGMGAGPGPRPAGTTSRSTARGPTTRRASPPRCASRACKPARGEGASKRAAEQAAATALLAREGVWKRGAMS